ncbi:hypothetical protein [Amycolatopsis sp. NPDC059657]|uniref:hypothetical protein n=1 Tax=Amycolatopsis sp. NPDC059657 TaxID=3346899 RepID=UPI0036731250
MLDELRDLTATTAAPAEGASPYERPLLPRPIVHSGAELRRFGDDLSGLLDILVSLPGRCFGGSVESFLAAQGRPSRAAGVICRGSTGEFERYGRADSVLSGGRFRVIEFNLGSDVGGVDIARVNRAFLRRPDVREFAERHALAYQDPAEALAARLRRACGNPDPVVGIVEENGANGTCGQIARALERHGLRVELAELGDVHTVDGRIALRDSAVVDVVVRYFFVDHVLRDRAGQRAMDQLVRAHQAGKTVLFTGFDSDVYGSKAALALLHLDAVRATLSAAERDLVHRLVPWTALVGSGFGIVGPAERRELIDLCLARRTELVLKPAFGNNSVGVRFGARMTEHEWAELLRAPVSADCVVQEHVSSDGGQLTGHVANWGVFVGDEGYAGVCLRALAAADRGVVGGSDGTLIGGVFTDG